MDAWDFPKECKKWHPLKSSKYAKSCPALWDPWTVAHQAPLSRGFSRQEYWSALPCPPPGNLPDPGIEPTSLLFPALAGGCHLGSPFKIQSLSQRWPKERKTWTISLRGSVVGRTLSTNGVQNTFVCGYQHILKVLTWGSDTQDQTCRHVPADRKPSQALSTQ